MLRLLPLLPLACLTESVSFTPEQDDAAFAMIENRWTATGTNPFSVTLCEDYAAEPAPPYEEPDFNTCQQAHILRGHGRGYPHEADAGGIGCGGCPFEVVAYVQGTIAGGDLTAPLTVSGIAFLGAVGDSNHAPYELPYTLELACDTADQPCTVTGHIRADGSLGVEAWIGTDSSLDPPTFIAALDLDAAATCPAP